MEATLDQLDTYVRTVSECLPGDDWLFRGLADWQQPLVPAIDRAPWRGPLGRDLEERMVERFRRSAAPAADPEPRDALGWLVLAQRQGIPTRLLEWTRSPLAALYYAVEDRSLDEAPGSGAVVAFRSHDFAFDEPLDEAERGAPWAVEGEPRRIEVPQRAATGGGLGASLVYTLHPEPASEVAAATFEGELHTFLFPNRARRLLRNELRLFGVQRAALQGDLAGLAWEIVADTEEGLRPPARRDEHDAGTGDTLH